jgi:ATP-dependent Clp protease ATP-binding subunit ClpA
VIEIENDARDYCVEHGYDPAYGARPLRRLIVNEIENRLASSIIAGECKSGTSVTIGCKNDGLVFSFGTVQQRKKELTGAQSGKR